MCKGLWCTIPVKKSPKLKVIYIFSLNNSQSTPGRYASSAWPGRPDQTGICIRPDQNLAGIHSFLKLFHSEEQQPSLTREPWDSSWLPLDPKSLPSLASIERCKVTGIVFPPWWLGLLDFNSAYLQPVPDLLYELLWDAVLSFRVWNTQFL